MNRFKLINSYIGLLLTLFLFFGCSSKKTITTENEKSKSSDIVSETINNEFKVSDTVNIIPNQDSSLVLYISEIKETSTNPVNNINFFVFDKKTNTVIYKNKFSNAKVSWHNTTELLLIRYFGIRENQNSEGVKKYLIELHSGDIKEIKNEKKSNI